MDPKFNPDTAKIYHFRYMREYRAVAVLWGLLSIIWCILNIVAFVQPQWIGDTPSSPGYGHLGVFQHCYPDDNYGVYRCSGTFVDFSTIINGSFCAATFFVGVSALLMLIVVAGLLLFFCFKKTAVFIFSGILQVYFGLICTATQSLLRPFDFVKQLEEGNQTIFMFLACVIYPNGWGSSEVLEICGTTASEYRLGECSIRWAYILAMLGIFDAAALALLAFFSLLSVPRSRFTPPPARSPSRS
ncbi:LOW QUALITY PROTEIN: LHFPL tetraspan subfamily member 3 protein-like [Pomacea canaliculata]|uniref:LOW QUALITY PROTEIN: LHFPL tetraspan subfamily member 3 protein-like n=1 Tax=Pomacea canaliculata TaxID=400727 RepID=UPI000D72BB4B|nr:LOW QUALITY PROTEIN: LHFPL tetraspan subfamily member 3 protein-like [Pomacea canaliculata]